jgi:acyl-CoA reductase-like NAD-dependent aldehyde dehydrogenase
MEDEIFGPLLPIRSIDSLDEEIEISSEVEKLLAMYIFTRNEEAVEEFLSRTRFRSNSKKYNLSLKVFVL